MNVNEKKATIECVPRDPNHPSVNEFRVSAVPDYEFADYQMGVPIIDALKTLPFGQDSTTAMLMTELEYLFDLQPSGFYLSYEFDRNNAHHTRKDSWQGIMGVKPIDIKKAFNKIGVRYDSYQKYLAEKDPFKGEYYCSIYNKDRNQSYYLRNSPVVEEAMSSVLLPGLTVSLIYKDCNERIQKLRERIKKDTEEGKFKRLFEKS